MKHVELTLELEKKIREHAEQTYPYECCGFLYGKENDGRILTDVLAVENSKEGDQRRRFEISPLDYLKAEQYALKEKLNLLGIYHSHPDHPAIASKHDLEKALPFFSYIIVSVKNGVSDEIQSWQLNEEIRQFDEEYVQVISAAPNKA
jgi:proteasome lid subunit RPN8/RPN11